MVNEFHSAWPPYSFSRDRFSVYHGRHLARQFRDTDIRDLREEKKEKETEKHRGSHLRAVEHTWPGGFSSEIPDVRIRYL